MKYRFLKHTDNWINQEPKVYYSIQRLRKFLWWTWWATLHHFDDGPIYFDTLEKAKDWVANGESWVKTETIIVQ